MSTGNKCLITGVLACLLLNVYADDRKTKILLIGKDRDHPYQTHEYMAWANLLAKCLRQTPDIEPIVSNGWPEDRSVLTGLDAIVMHNAMGGDFLVDQGRREEVLRLLENGVGLTAVHWSTAAQNDEAGNFYLANLGGWFRKDFAQVIVTTHLLEQADGDHPISRGWQNYELRDEYYLGLRFAAGMKPALKVHANGQEYVVGWSFERPRGSASRKGRSFGCVLGHFHEEFAIPAFRTMLVNGILWTAHRDVPKTGAPCTITDEDMVLSPDTRKKPETSR
ncbi:MAG: ThuA domain-containing protein [Acidobacteriota bacterium]